MARDIPASSLLNFARRLSDAASAETLPRFRANLAAPSKNEEWYDPVTEADRAAEQAIRTLIGDHYPDHAIIGEELGTSAGSAPFAWVLDPIDGTQAFLCGMPTWATLIGLLHEDAPLLGVMHQPFIDERFLGSPEGSFLESAHGRTRLQARPTRSLNEALVACTTPDMYRKGGKEGVLEAVRGATRSIRYGTDAYGYCLLAAGHIDLVVEAGLGAYDVVALIPIVEQAGGVITTWTGEAAKEGGEIVAAATPQLHEAAIRLLSG